jgi:hypothetical protein
MLLNLNLIANLNRLAAFKVVPNSKHTLLGDTNEVLRPNVFLPFATEVSISCP